MLTFPKLNTTKRKKKKTFISVLKNLTLVQMILPKEAPNYIFLKFFFSHVRIFPKLSCLTFDLNMEIMCPDHLKWVSVNSDPPSKWGVWLLSFRLLGNQFWSVSLQLEVITFPWKWFTMEAYWRGRLGLDVVAIRKCYFSWFFQISNIEP